MKSSLIGQACPLFLKLHEKKVGYEGYTVFKEYSLEVAQKDTGQGRISKQMEQGSLEKNR